MTQDVREEMRRHFGVLAEDLRSQIQQVAEGVTANGEAIERLRGEAEVFRAETRGNFAAVGREFAAVRGEMAGGLSAVRGEMAEGLAAVRGEAQAFREETAHNFATLRAEIVSGRTGIPLSRRPRTRRRPH